MSQNLADIQAAMQQYGISPRKRFGQNFLHDKNQIQRIEAVLAPMIQICKPEVILEVGPGTGTLTESLLDYDRPVIAVEVDRQLATMLRDRFADQSHVTLLETDVMAGKQKLDATVTEALGERSFVLVANLPYNIASPLLVNLAKDYPQMHAALVMVQSEVADRMIACSGKVYGLLSVMLQVTMDVQKQFDVPPASFWPRPSVQSSVVRMDRRNTPLVKDLHDFRQFIAPLFQQRRKQIRKAIGDRICQHVGVDPTARVENLPPATLVELFLQEKRE